MKYAGNDAMADEGSVRPSGGELKGPVESGSFNALNCHWQDANFCWSPLL